MLNHDLNAKVGRGKYSDIVGQHSLGERNERGETWIQWCEQNDQVITNTFFAHHPRRLWTWRSPDNKHKNQIDFITVNRRFRNAIVQVKGYPGADCDSDHAMVVASVRLRLKRQLVKKKYTRLQISQLQVKAAKTDTRILSTTKM